MKYHIDKAHIKSMMKEKKRKTDDYIDQYLSTLQHVTLPRIYIYLTTIMY